MPNWVYNTLTIEGSPESVIKLKEQMNKPFKYSINANGDLAYNVEERVYSNPVFAFWNIVAPTDMDVYHTSAMGHPDSWYNWNNRNWSVKWDVAVADDNEYPDTSLYKDEPNGENHVLVYGFETPWGVPINALQTLSSQYPDLLFTLSFEEETGWGGEDEFLRGEYIQGAGYNWKCKECDYEELGEPPYCEECQFDMCPSCGWGEPMDEDRENCEIHKMVEA